MRASIYVLAAYPFLAASAELAGGVALLTVPAKKRSVYYTGDSINKLNYDLNPAVAIGPATKSPDDSNEPAQKKYPARGRYWSCVNKRKRWGGAKAWFFSCDDSTYGKSSPTVQGEEDLQHGEVHNGDVYYGALSVGTPAQITTVHVDTFTSGLSIPVSECKECFGPTLQTAQSSTYNTSGRTFNTSIGNGRSFSGQYATDTVTFAGLTVQNQSFIAVTQETHIDTEGSGPEAGAIGLGFAANAPPDRTPFFTRLVQSGSLASDLFGAYLTKGVGETGSEICLGCVDTTKLSGNFTYFDLDSSVTGGVQVYWNAKSEGFSWGGGASSGSFSAAFDVGTLLSYLPVAIADRFYANIPGSARAPQLGQGIYTYPCNATLQPIVLHMTGSAFELDPSDFKAGNVSQSSLDCVGSIAGRDIVNGTIGIIGQSFLKSWYSVYDYGNKRVGLASSLEVNPI